MIDNRGGTIHVAVDLFGHREQDLIIDFFLLVDLFHKKPAGSFNHRQGLVQFMRHTGGHLSKGGHFTSLDKLLLGLQTLGDIAGGDQQHFLPRILGW